MSTPSIIDLTEDEISHSPSCDITSFFFPNLPTKRKRDASPAAVSSSRRSPSPAPALSEGSSASGGDEEPINVTEIRHEVAVPRPPPPPLEVGQLTASDLFLFPFSTSVTSALHTSDGCHITFISRFLSPLAIRLLHAELAAITTWQEGTLRGHPVPRVSCWFSGSPYRFGAKKWPFFPHPPVLQHVQTLLNAHLHEHVDPTSRPLVSVLVNKYRSGTDSVAPHADDEEVLGPRPTIASVNLGVTRTFCMARKVKKAGEKRRRSMKFELNEGSLLLMAGETQTHYLHWVPKQPEREGVRYNLTFRTRHE